MSKYKKQALSGLKQLKATEREIKYYAKRLGGKVFIPANLQVQFSICPKYRAQVDALSQV